MCWHHHFYYQKRITKVMSNSVEVQFKDESMSLPLEEESTTPHDSNRGISVGGNSKHNEETMDEEERQFLSVFGSAYAKNAQFWKGIFISCLPQGILMALIALLFFNLYTALANATWLTAEYHHALNATSASLEEDSEEDPIYMFRLGNGEWWYVGLLAGAGLAVGLVKTIWNLLVPERHAFPRKVPGFLVDIQGLHADNVFLPLPMLICSAISIGLGAAVGPEAGLGYVQIIVMRDSMRCEIAIVDVFDMMYSFIIQSNWNCTGNYSIKALAIRKASSSCISKE